jgi:hypothetical protein
MDGNRFDGIVRSLPCAATRRGVVGVLFGGAALGLHTATGKKKRKKKKKPCRTCCRADGVPCRKKNARCKPAFCPRFTVTARWDSDRNYDTYLFVPDENGGNTTPTPFIDKLCNICDRDVYPFACVDRDAEGPGNEVTRILKALPNNYDYWLELPPGAPAGDVTVTLRDRGRLRLTLTNPANPSDTEVGSWRVFDLDVEFDDLDIEDVFIQDNLPRAKTAQNRFVCA